MSRNKAPISSLTVPARLGRSLFRVCSLAQSVGVTSVGVIIVAASLCTACTPHVKEWEPNKDEKKVFFFPVRSLPPQPVYSRVMEVRPPSVLPPRSLPTAPGPKILPVLHLELQAVPLEEAAKVLAKSARYSYYCSSLVADKKVSIDSLGTIDELGQMIAKKANVEVVVDHSNQEVRFLSGNLLLKAPELP
jgi:hypothetical protein